MKKEQLGAILNGAGNKAKNVFDKAKEKTILAVDQNDDGKFDMTDVSAVADTVGGAVKKGANAVKESAIEARQKMDLKLLQPIFPETLTATDFTMSKLICVVDRDKKHAESDVCQNSIGFVSNKAGLRVVNVFNDSLDAFGLTFFPDVDSMFYYVNPVDRDNYIALDDYFSYLKNVRVNELQRVAQDLGASHFRVLYKEERTSFSSVKAKAHAKVSNLGNIDVEHSASEKKFSLIEVAAELSMDAHAPKKPKLVYLAKDVNVENLIRLRMTSGEGLHNQKFSIKMSNSSGIKRNDAVKIDAVFKEMKFSGNCSIISEAENESRRYLDYEIDF